MTVTAADLHLEPRRSADGKRRRGSFNVVHLEQGERYASIVMYSLGSRGVVYEIFPLTPVGVDGAKELRRVRIHEQAEILPRVAELINAGVLRRESLMRAEQEAKRAERAKAQAAEDIRARKERAAEAMYEALRLYVTTYMHTQTHPKPIEEAAVMLKAEAALKLADEG